MTADAARTRHQRRVEELCEASIRALSGTSALHFRGGRLHYGESPVLATASHLRILDGEDDFSSFRGAADGLALRVAHSDPLLHQALAPAADEVGAMVFEILEQFRVEALVDPGHSGVVANLRHRHETWSLTFRESGLTESEQGMLLYTLAQVCRSKVTAEPVVASTEDLIEHARFALSGVIGAELAELRRQRNNQEGYAALASAIAASISQLIADAAASSPASARNFRGIPRNLFSLAAENREGREAPTGVALSGGSHLLSAGGAGYRVFTHAYDRELAMAQIVRPAQLLEYRAQVDEQVTRSAINVGRLGRQLRKALGDTVQDGWDAEQDEGTIDGRALTRLITNPSDHRLFRVPRDAQTPDCAVSILLDCSGSMRRHSRDLTTILDILTRAFDLADISSEVLGFSTGSWNGGRALRDWKRAGQPAHPGRLNERLHIIVKDSNTSWRRARPALAGLLRQDLYREAIDGEAVAWACSRLAARPESRKILLVVSDGSPMDSATNLVNDDHYLGEHLRHIVADTKSQGQIAVVGLGVGLDLSPFYEQNRVIDLDEEIDMSTLTEILELLASTRARFRT